MTDFDADESDGRPSENSDANSADGPVKPDRAPKTPPDTSPDTSPKTAPDASPDASTHPSPDPPPEDERNSQGQTPEHHQSTMFLGPDVPHNASADKASRDSAPADNSPADGAAAADSPTADLPPGDAGHDTQPHNKNAWAGRQLGPFTLEQEVGRGGMGVVYRARHQTLERTFALKILPLASQLNSDQLRRFENESRAAAQLNHPHIVPLFEVGDDQDTHYYSMQFVEGENLNELIRSTRQQVSQSQGRRGDSETPAGGLAETIDLQQRPPVPKTRPAATEDSRISLSADDFLSAARLKRLPSGHRLPSNIASIGLCVAQALQYAHEQGIVHRDIKPSNLMLDGSGKVWVTDFGLAMIRSAPSITQAGMILGTLRYMSPEQASGRRAYVDHRTDVFSLGITLYELVTLRNAFTGKGDTQLLQLVTQETPPPIRKACPSIPEDLATIIEKAYERNPDDRYQTAAAMAEDLQRFLDGRPILASRPSLSRRFRQWCVEHERLATAGFMAIVCALLLAATTAGIIYADLGEAYLARKLAEERLAESEARRLTTLALLERETNPGRAQALARQGALNSEGVESQTVLLQASDGNHELLLAESELPWVQQLDISPDGSQLVEVSQQQFSDTEATIAVRNVSDGSLRQVLGRQQRSPSVAFDPSGRFLVVCVRTDAADQADEAGSGDDVDSPNANANENQQTPFSSAIQLWTTDDLQQVISIPSSLRDARLLGINADATRLAVPAVDGQLQIVSTRDARVVVDLQDDGAVFTEAEFSPDGTLVLGVTTEGDVVVFDVSTERPIGRIVGKAPAGGRPSNGRDVVRRARFSFDSQLIVTSGRGVFVHEVGNTDGVRSLTSDSIATRREARVLLSGRRNEGLAFHPYYSSLTFIDLTTGAPLVNIRSAAAPKSVGLLPGGKTCYLQEQDRIRLFSTVDGQPLASLDGHTKPITAVTASEAAGKLVSADQSGRLFVWSLQSGRERRGVPTHRVIANQRQLTRTNATGSQRLSGPVMGYRTQLLDVAQQTVDQQDADATEFVGRLCRDGIRTSGRVMTLLEDSVAIHDATTQQLLGTAVSGLGVLRARSLNDDIALLSTGDGRLYWYHLGLDRLRLLGPARLSVDGIPLSADGGRFAYPNAQGLVIICETQTGEEVSRMGTAYEVLDMDFHPLDGSLVMACAGSRVESQTADGRPGVYALQSDAPIPPFNQLQFTRDGTSLLTWSSRAGQIRAWDAQTGELIGQQPCPQLTGVRLHPTRPTVLLFSRYGGAWQWDVVTDDLQQLSDRRVIDAALTGERVCLLSESGPVQSPPVGEPPPREELITYVSVRELDTDQRLLEKSLPIRAEQLDVNADASVVAVTTACFGVSVVNDQFPEQPIFVGSHREVPIAASFLGADRITTISRDGSLETRQTTGALIRRQTHAADLLTAAAITTDGQWAATGGSTGALKLWRLDADQAPLTIAGHQARITQMVFSHDGSRLAVADTAERLRFYSVPDGREIADFEIGCLHVALSPDGQQAVVLSGSVEIEMAEDGGVRTSWNSGSLLLLDVNAKQQRVLQEQTRGLTCQFSRRGTEFLVLQTGGTVAIFDAAGNPQTTLESIDQHFVAAAFVQGGTHVVTASRDRLSVWETASGAGVYEYPWDGNAVAATGANWTPESASPGEFLTNNGDRLEGWPLDVIEFTAGTTRALTAEERSEIKLRSEPAEP